MPGEEKILFLGPESSPLLVWLRDQGEDVVQTMDEITLDFIDDHAFSFLVSYGYRHILRRPVLGRFPKRAINLHISFLPWNRGADPNFWSFVERTPKGVSIHYVDEGVDTGDILVQREVSMDSKASTLATSYARLKAEIEELFKVNWIEIKRGRLEGTEQSGTGTSHRAKDKERLNYLLTDGWDTPVSALGDLDSAS